MRLFILLTLALGLCANLKAQKDHQVIFEMATSAASFDYDQLVDFAEEQLTEEEDIARFFYYWIGQNITYDFTTAVFGLENGLTAKETQPDFVIRHKKATCTGYTNLYSTFLSYFGILHRTVLGYSRHQSNLLEQIPPVLDHAWSAIYLNGKWQLVDVSWANGFIDSPMMRDHYFLTSPKAFINDHLPVDEEWFLGAEKIGLKDFERQPFINVPYFGLTQKAVIRPKFSKTNQGEWVVELDDIKGLNLKLLVIETTGKAAKSLKYKKKKNKADRSIRFVLRNYEPGDLLRLDALRVGQNSQVTNFIGLAYLAHPDWQWPKTEEFRQFSTKQNRH